MPRKATPAVEPATRKPRTVARSATTGRAVSKAAAAADPAGTVVEKVYTPLEDFLRKFKAPTKIPKNFGAVADLLHSTRLDRLALSKAVSDIEEFEKALKNYLIDNLSKKDATGAAGKFARAQIVVEDMPRVEDWDSFYKHIKKTGSFELLNRALNRTAANERLDNGKTIPGVGVFPVTKVSVTKI